MLKKFALVLAVFSTAVAAHATTVNFTGSSLQGSTGSLDITATGNPDEYLVIWSLDTTGFNDATATSTNHTLLTHIAFKAFTSLSSVSFAAEPGDNLTGTLFANSNLSGNGCSLIASAGFVCVDITDVDATINTVYQKSFLVVGTLDTTLAWTFKGKYGPGPGWVISEQAPPIPEPASAALFGLGVLVAGAALRKRIRR
jgi:hypothetical protein